MRIDELVVVLLSCAGRQGCLFGTTPSLVALWSCQILLNHEVEGLGVFETLHRFSTGAILLILIEGFILLTTPIASIHSIDRSGEEA